MSATEYGIHCLASDEKTLVANINRFLVAQGYRKLYKRAPSGLRDPANPGAEPRYRHCYCQFLKQHPRWYFDLYPNVDMDGRARFPHQPKAGWTLYGNQVSPESNSEQDNACVDAFFRALVDALGFSTCVLHVYAENEDRR